MIRQNMAATKIVLSIVKIWKALRILSLAAAYRFHHRIIIQEVASHFL